jgi:hypothetical protein
MARRLPTTLPLAIALALLALAACGDPAANRGPTGGTTSNVRVSPSGLGMGGLDGQGGVAAPARDGYRRAAGTVADPVSPQL